MLSPSPLPFDLVELLKKKICIFMKIVFRTVYSKIKICIDRYIKRVLWLIISSFFHFALIIKKKLANLIKKIRR